MLDVKCYEQKLCCSSGELKEKLFSLLISYSFILILYMCFLGSSSHVWKVNMVPAISGGITKRDICFPLELGDDWC